MDYEISKDEWHVCKMCQKTIQDLAKTYGGGGVYYIQVFRKHLDIEHGISPEEYFATSCNIDAPICKCGQCDKHTILKVKGSKFEWKDMACGRYEGLMKWSEEAKITRKGKGNPMYDKPAWNKGLSASSSESVANMVQKAIGRKMSDESRQKMSESAKKRTVHGHTGHKHSEESKEKMRQATLRRIKEGSFKHTKTAPHIAFSKILLEAGIAFEEEKTKSYWSFDFYLPDHDVWIEVDGDYWHSNPIVYPDGPKTKAQKRNFTRDQSKNSYCYKNRMTLYRFWERDILNEPEEILWNLKALLGLGK